VVGVVLTTVVMATGVFLGVLVRRRINQMLICVGVDWLERAESAT
jgi:hypothetical protein